MPQFIVKRYNGGDKPETEYLRVDAEDELAAATKACGGELLMEKGKPGDLRAVVKPFPKGRQKAFHRPPGPVSR
jgi:hypothetical protein